MKPGALEAVFDDLMRTDNPVHQFYGGFGKLALRTKKLGDRPLEQSDLQLIDRIRSSISKWEQADRKVRARSASIARGELLKMRTAHEKQVSTGALIKTHRLTTNRLTGVDPAPRILFEPIPDFNVAARFLIKVNDQLDLLWSRSEVSLMTAPGKTQPICGIRNDRDCVFHAACDGRFVWVASIADGIRIFDLNGQLQAQFTPDGQSDQSPDTLPTLPTGPCSNVVKVYFANPFARSIFLHPLSPGRCLVSGQIGADQRRWFGEVVRQSDGKQWHFKSWLEASRAMSDDEPNDPVDTRFQPAFFLRYRLSRRADVTLTARPCPGNGSGIPKTAVAFDLETGQASVIPSMSIPHISSRIHEALQVGSSVLVANDGLVRYSPPTGRIGGSWKTHTILSRTDPKWRRTGRPSRLCGNSAPVSKPNRQAIETSGSAEAPRRRGLRASTFRKLGKVATRA